MAQFCFASRHAGLDACRLRLEVHTAAVCLLLASLGGFWWHLVLQRLVLLWQWSVQVHLCWYSGGPSCQRASQLAVQLHQCRGTASGLLLCRADCGLQVDWPPPLDGLLLHHGESSVLLLGPCACSICNVDLAVEVRNAVSLGLVLASMGRSNSSNRKVIGCVHESHCGVVTRQQWVNWFTCKLACRFGVRPCCPDHQQTCQHHLT